MSANPHIPSPLRYIRRPLGECLGFEAEHLAAHVDAWRHEIPDAAAEYLDILAERLCELAMIAHRDADTAKRMQEAADELVELEREIVREASVERGSGVLRVIEGGKPAVLHDFARTL